ncbi:DUF1769-domain-containing protein [Violaceomyces palustris]|uniref:DUF1769-domain-containing protein n=1 Tax=Violaceomyces palustris TaxID=1673888 RepID=A0ACD0NVY6_9BASI|nr:DUF1769-domain-containing protein [Violaceomyces palustris]
MPRLLVQVGPDRFHMETCRLNDSRRPHEINTEHFVGRVLVRILDAPGAREGEEGREYFKDRSRKFCIQIEGRFKRPWNGDQIQFGSDFDKFIDFPRAPFNAGMRVAKYIDPCTFYEEHPPSGRPYIMSPYIACMNTFCAWPAPSRAHDAVVVLRHTRRSGSPDSTNPSSPLIEPAKGAHGDPSSPMVTSPHASEDEEGDVVPTESLDRSHSQSDKAKAKDEGKKKRGWLSSLSVGGHAAQKEERKLKKYWRFVGFKDDPRVRALLEAHNAKLRETSKSGGVERQTSVSSNTSTAAVEVQHAPAPPTLSRLGTGLRREANRTPDRPGTPTHSAPAGVVSPIQSPLLGSGEGGFASLPPEEPRPEMPKLQRITTSIRTEMEASAKSDGLKDGDFKLADALHHTHLSHGDGSGGDWKSMLDDQLGPWRFDDPGTDMVEDNAFIFTHESLTVPKRRKYFASEKHRKDFVYDPDVVYGASFFTDVMDFNTFNMAIGPVRINVSRFFQEMPVRYTLRASGDEELTFCTISFQLVD